MSVFTDALENRLMELGLKYEPALPGKCEAYYRHVMEANRHLNLTRIPARRKPPSSTSDGIVRDGLLKHDRVGCVIVDVGKGAAFPAYRSKLFPSGYPINAMDASCKKTDFIRRTLADWVWTAEVLSARAENAAHPPCVPNFDLAVSRLPTPRL